MNRWVQHGPPQNPIELNRQSSQMKGLVGLWFMGSSWGGGIIKNLASGLGSSDGIVDIASTWDSFALGRAMTVNANDAINFGPNVWIVGGDYTLSFWVNFPSTPGASINWDKRPGAADGGWRINFLTTGRLRLHHYAATPSNGLLNNTVQFDGTHLYTLKYDSTSGIVYFYRDGLLLGSDTLGVMVTGTPADLSIDNASGFSYSLFEMRLYNRMLSDIEILGLYNVNTRWSLFQLPHQPYGFAALTALLKLKSETVNISDSGIRIRSLIRLLTETFSLIGANISARGLIRFLAETFSLTDTNIRFRNLVRVLAEISNLTDTNIRIRSLIRFLAETFSLIDASIRFRNLIRVLAETFNVNDIIVRVRNLIRLLAETFNLIGVVVRIRSVVRFLAEIVNISSTNINIRSLIRFLTETLNLTDTNVSIKGLIRVLAETLNLTGVTTNIRGLIRLLAETLSLIDANARFRGLIKVLVEIVNIGDIIANIRGLIRLLAETVNLTEGIRTIRSILMSLIKGVKILLNKRGVKIDD